jgi:hypothetical protein
LLNQEIKPDRIVLWLSNEEISNRTLPKTLTSLHGIDIRWCENLKSYNKLIPALRSLEFRNDTIITADDDIIYKSNWFKLLLEEHIKDPSAIIYHRGHSIKTHLDGSLKSYLQWGMENTDGPFVFPTGVAGILYPPGSLHEKILDSKCRELAPTGDDICFYAMGLLQGTRYQPTAEKFHLIHSITPNAPALFDINVKQGRNDIQLHQVFQYFKIYELMRWKPLKG